MTTTRSRARLADVVRDALLADLDHGQVRDGGKLPNETELAERFQVSRATVREAVSGLVEAGYLDRRHGSGTYVTGRPVRRHALDATLSYTDMIRAGGQEPGLDLLGTRRRPATEEEHERLALPAGEPVLEVERVRTADARPVVYSLDRIPVRLLPDPSTLAPSLYAVLAAAGHGVVRASARLLPVRAGARLASRLGLPRGALLQYLDQTDYDAAGRPVMLSAEWHVPEAFELRVDRSTPGSR